MLGVKRLRILCVFAKHYTGEECTEAMERLWRQRRYTALLNLRHTWRFISRSRRFWSSQSAYKNCKYLVFQISAILYADRGDQGKLQSPHRANLAIFAVRRDRAIARSAFKIARCIAGFRFYGGAWHLEEVAPLLSTITTLYHLIWDGVIEQISKPCSTCGYN